MEMNDILNGLNPCDDNSSSNTNSTDSAADSCCYGGAGIGPTGIGASPLGFGGGCGFGSWIWILLILFYCGCGNGLLGGGYGNSGNCCRSSCDSCCNPCGNNCGCGNNRGLFGGMFGSCTSYLFLLVILFLCNSNFGGFGAGNPYASLGGYGGNLNLNGNYGC